MSDDGPVSAGRLKSFVERIAKLHEERKAITADITDVVNEAKGVGYIPKTLRKVVARYLEDPAKLAEDDLLLETYEVALGRVGKALADVRAGSTWEEASKENDVPRATLARAAAVSKRGEVIPTDVLEAGTDAGCLLASATSGQLAACPSTPLQPDLPTTTETTGEDDEALSDGGGGNGGTPCASSDTSRGAGNVSDAGAGGSAFAARDEGHASAPADAQSQGATGHGEQAPLKLEMGHPPSEADAGPIPTFLIRQRVSA